MIERLVTLLTPPTPYLGVDRPMAPSPVAPAAPFMNALKASAPLPNAPPLLSQNLQLSVQARGLTPTPRPIAPLTPQMLQGLHSLSQPMAAAVTQHPVVCLSLTGLTPQQLLEQQWLRQLMFHRDERDPVITQGLLTFLAVERPFTRDSPRLRHRSVQGHGFLRFRFAWEQDEEMPDAQKRD